VVYLRKLTKTHNKVRFSLSV